MTNLGKMMMNGKEEKSERYYSGKGDRNHTRITSLLKSIIRILVSKLFYQVYLGALF